MLDVGANVGDLTIPLSRIVGGSGPVCALESHPGNFNVSCANLALSSVRNTKPINTFVATCENVATSRKHWGEFVNASRTENTQFLALASDLAAIEVDVDGKEPDVLQSAEMQIDKYRSVLYFEYDTRKVPSEPSSYATDAPGHDLHLHLAPILEEDNFFDNPVNHLRPRSIASLMVLGDPNEPKVDVPQLTRVADRDEWWVAHNPPRD